MEEKEKPDGKATIKFVFLPLVATFLILAAIAAPGYFCYRPACHCGPVELDAHNIAMVMAAHLSVPGQQTITREDIEKRLKVTIDNPWSITNCGDSYCIHVVDRERKCPPEYQNNEPDWNAGIYTLTDLAEYVEARKKK